jgi:hypothetical protein
MAITVLRELWRRRYSVGVGIAYALLVMILMTFRVTLGFPPKIESRQYNAGIAASDVLIDSPNSQVVDVGGGTTDVEGATIDLNGLSTRARLLANLMSNSPLKDRVAKAAGISSSKLLVIAPTSADGTQPATPDSPSVKVKIGDRDANVLALFVDETLPILTMRVQAPDSATAKQLATSAVSQLRVYLKTVASADQVPDARQLVISPLGPATSATVVKGPRRLFAILAGLLVLALWCAITVMFPRLVRTWQDAARAEAAEAERQEPAPKAEPDADLVPWEASAPSAPSPPVRRRRRPAAAAATGDRQSG